MLQNVSGKQVSQENQIICFACADPFAITNHLKQLLHTAIDSEQYEVVKQLIS